MKLLQGKTLIRTINDKAITLDKITDKNKQLSFYRGSFNTPSNIYDPICFFAIIANSWKPLAVFAKISLADDWQGPNRSAFLFFYNNDCTHKLK